MYKDYTRQEGHSSQCSPKHKNLLTVPQCGGWSFRRMRVVKWSVSSVSQCCVEFCQRLDHGPYRDLYLSPSLDPCLCHNLGLCRAPSPYLAPSLVLGYQT